MWPSCCRSEKVPAGPVGPPAGLRRLAAVLLLLACSPQDLPGVLAAGPEEGQASWWSADLVEHLRTRGWEPPYFKDTVPVYPDGLHLDLARRALRSPTETITIGGFDYRTSPALVDAGREIFQNYHFGTHLYWDFRRAIDFATGVTDPADYARRYGVKRDRAGRFVGIVGVAGPGGRVLYGHSCALCHANVDESGAVVFGMPNHDFDLGLYYDALRPLIRDAEKVFLGDGPLPLLRFQGAGRTDPAMDSFWAPVKVPHLFALRGLEHGLRSNGDTTNLWLQCYRNLNGRYAVDSEIMEALMAFLLSLRAPANPRVAGELEARGAAVFQAQRCHRCHAPPNYTTGLVVPWEVIRTDSDRIRNGYPKGYRVASLLRLDLLKLYLHDGSLTSLEQLFDRARTSPTFEPPGIPPGRRKQGAGVRGHEFGLSLSPEDRAALIAFLKSL